MSLEFRTLQPEEFYRQHLSGGERPDGRGLHERRPVTISSGHIRSADGSAVVKSGHTTVVCGVRAELTSPGPDHPDQGYIVPNFTFANSSLGASVAGVHATQRLSQFLLTVLDTSQCINTRDLCIKSGHYVWVLYIDLVCLDQAGNLMDTAVTAMIAALDNVTLPNVSVDDESNEVKVSTKNRHKLKLLNHPSSSSVVIFSNSDNPSCPYLVSDPTEEEENLSSSLVTVVTVDDEVCHLINPGGELLTPTLLQQTRQNVKAIDMTLLKLPVKSPSLKLVLSLLKQSSNSEIDWFLVHLASEELSQYLTNTSETATAKQIFHEATKLFIEDIKTICGNTPENKPKLLTQYLSQGRGLLLISGLQKTVKKAALFDEELCAVLLSLESFLNSSGINDEAIKEDCPLLDKVLYAECISFAANDAIDNKKRRPCYRSQKVRRRVSRSGFPDVVSGKNNSRNVGENLTEWEGSPSSDDQDTDHGNLYPQSSQIKYIPINYFEYFDNANLDSDEFSSSSLVGCEHPPALPVDKMKCSPGQMMETCLYIVSVIMSQADVAVPRVQSALLQLGVVACNQLKCGVWSTLSRCQLVVIICQVITSVRHRPDLVHTPPLQTILACLVSVLGPGQPSLASTWGQAATCSLTIWRDLTAANVELAAVSGIINIVSAVLEGLKVVNCDDSNVIQCLVSVLKVIPDTDFVYDTVNKVLDIVSSKEAFHHIQVQVLEQLTLLFKVYCYPEAQLSRLTSRIEIFSCGDNFKSYLTMLEQVMDNLAESEHKWTGASLMSTGASKETDRDSALSSSENDFNSVEENNNRYSENQNSNNQEFEPYLDMLENGDETKVEMVIQHIEKIVIRADGDTRHRLALQVLLPYLSSNIHCNISDDKEEKLSHVESVLVLLSHLVTQQPTAMALIRNQSTWRQIKFHATSDSQLSTTTQLVIRNIVLNSNKFIKIRLTDAEAMTLLDDENDIINFDQRDRNAQSWLFKQFYHVLMQSSMPVINGDVHGKYDHISSAWLVANDLVQRLPEFLVYSIERGVITLGLQLLDTLPSAAEQKKDVADALGRIVQFITYVLKSKPSWDIKIPNIEMSNPENFYEVEIVEKVKFFLANSGDLKADKTVLTLVLDSSCENLSNVVSKHSEEFIDDGYEADQSDVDEESQTLPSMKTISVSFKPGIKLFCWGLEQILKTSRHLLEERLQCLEYLLYKFSQLDLSEKVVNQIINEGTLSSLLHEVFVLSQQKENDKLNGVIVFVMKIVGKVSETYLSPDVIKNIFKLINNKNNVQKQVLTLFASMLVTRVADYNIPGISIIGSKARDRLSSTKSSDSGLDSCISLSSNNLSLSSSRKMFIKDPVDDLEKDFTIVLRLKIDIDTAACRGRDEWVELISVENRNEKIGVQVNLLKGLKLTLSNSRGTFAAAETNFQSIFEPGKWTHLVINIGTVSEGSRNTKTLSAFVDCCRVWDVGLSVDNRTVNLKTKREKFLSLIVGPSSGGSSLVNTGLDIQVSDVFFIGNTGFTLQDIVKDYLTESRYLLYDQSHKSKPRINLKRLGEKLPDLIGYFLPLVDGDGPLSLSTTSSQKLVAHFSPTGLWNSRTFQTKLNSWTLQHGIFSAGGLDSVLLLPAAALEFGFDEHVLSLCFNAAINFVVSDQEIFKIFLNNCGGFPLFTHLLKTCSGTNISRMVETFLCNAGWKALQPTGFNPNSRILLFPELIKLLLEVPSVTEKSMQQIIQMMIEFINEDNVYNRFNLNFLKSSGLLSSIFSCLVSLSKEGHKVPVEEVSTLLTFVPSSQEIIDILIKSSILLCPPHLLYLPCSVPEGPPPPTTSVNLSEVEYFEKIHSKEVVDLSSILNNSLQSSKSVPDLPEVVTNLEYLETEEDVVGEWEVITSNPPEDEDEDDKTQSLRSHSSLCSTPLLSSLINAAVVKMRLLSDSSLQKMFAPHLLLPLVSHPSPEVHSGALQILRLMMEPRPVQRATSHNYEELFELVGKLIAGHPPSPLLVEAVLSLVHSHHINIDIAYEFSMTTYNCVNMQAVTVILPSVLRSCHSEVSLCHNFITHIHELAANIPSFLSRLIECNIYQSLFSMLLQIAATPGDSSDLCGYFESDLIVEDINNLLRLIIVKYIDQTQAEFETVLDMVFFAAALIQKHSSQVTSYLRSALSLCLEEGLYTLQIKASDYRIYRPSHFLNIEDGGVCTDIGHNNTSRQRRSDWVGCNLSERFSKLIKFSVNCLSSFVQPILDEEIGLFTSIYNMILELEMELSRKKNNDPLVKSLRDNASLGGVALLALLKSDISLTNKIGLIRKIDALPSPLAVIQKLFTTPEERETFRLGVISLVSQSLVMDNVDCEMISRFYGDLLSVSVFPDGPGSSQPLDHVHHKTYQPWQAERDRLSLTNDNISRKRSDYLRGVAEKLTNIVVDTHDNLMKASLERMRKSMCESYDSRIAWQNIVSSQTHLLGLWHNDTHQPKSLVLENVSGTSGIYTRLKPGHCGLSKNKYFKESSNREPMESSQQQKPFIRLLGSGLSEEISLSDRLGGVEKVQVVETVTQVTATSQVEGELVVSGDKIYFVSTDGWNCSFKGIDAAMKRRYQLKDIAIEFFLSSGESHLIVFQTSTERNCLSNILSQHGVLGQLKSANLEVTTKLWRQKHLTNFQYLMELNRLSGRTFSDLMQYPVFPWILADYSSHLDLTLPQSFRCLKKPIAVQKPGSEDKYVTNYNILSSDGTISCPQFGPYHFASHYSNTGIVLHFLVRLPPYTGEFIKFQDGNFDLPDRSFHKIETSWLMASEISASDVKELIPQLFYLPEMFLNTENFKFGVKQNGDEVDSVELPAWADGDPRTFVKVHRQALESAFVRQELAHWIDLVFGYKQTGQEAIEAVNVFHPATYPSNQTQNLDEVEARARQTMIETYGQTPLQLFTFPHPLPLAELVSSSSSVSPTPVLSTVSGLTWGSYVGAPNQPCPNVVWQQNQGVIVSRLVKLETNEIIGLPSRCLLIGRYNIGRSLGQIYSGLQLLGSHLLTWGHSDNTLHCKVSGDLNEVKVSDDLLAWDQIVSGASHPRVSAVWFGHQSGLMSVHRVSVTHGSKQPPHVSSPTYLHGHTDLVTDIKLCPEFGIAVSSSQAGNVITWDLHSHQLLHTINIDSSGSSLVHVAISGKCGDIAIAVDSHLYLYTINLKHVTDTDIGDSITSLTFSNEEEGVSINCVALGIQTGQVRLHSSLDLKYLRDVVGAPNSPVTSLEYSEDSQNLAVSTLDGSVTIFEKSGNKGLNRTPRYVTLQ